MPRKLILQTHISMDGFMAGPSRSMDWVTFAWDNELKAHVDSLMASADHIVLGRKLAEGFIPHWLARPSHEEPAGIDHINSCRKTVFTSTLEKSPWGENVDITRSPLRDELIRLKEAEGGDIMAYGGVNFVKCLAKENIIDEFYFLVNPVALGDGDRIFEDMTTLELVDAKPFECGIVVLHYRPKRVEA